MRILVTGGAGFIGSRLVRGLLGDEYSDEHPGFADAHVTVFDKLTYAGNLANLAPVADDPRLTVVRGDITSAADLDTCAAGHDLVVNLAGETHVDRSIAAADEFVHTNVVGAQQVFDACVRHGIGRVVHVSTDEVYGSVDTGACAEDRALRPSSPYAASKAAADLVANAYAVSFGLDVRVTRSTNNYGPYQFPEKIIPLFATNLIDARPVPLYGSGAHRRDWLHVDDHCRALALVADRGEPGDVYNVAGLTELSNRELTGRLLTLLGRDDGAIEQVPDPRGPGHDLRYAVDVTKIAGLGYAPRVPFEAGLAATVEWYREHESWWRPLVTR